ncbi:hypothetical protein GCM10023169_25700 [Georgenia halophila]|uniref:Uncharacterized protein n=1 Tax=Georgenia halophila TaxID=620889 RepID=A0ABP8LD20_9MICO
MIDHTPELHLLRYREMVREAEALHSRRATRRPRTTPFVLFRRASDSL